MRPIRIRPRHRPGEMNKTEAAYAQKLEAAKLAGVILDYKFESVKLKLAPATFLTPDFLVIKPDGFELHEVKGFWEEDARVKIKVAAEMYPWFQFIAVQRSGKEWKVEMFK